MRERERNLKREKNLKGERERERRNLKKEREKEREREREREKKDSFDKHINYLNATTHLYSFYYYVISNIVNNMTGSNS